MFWKFESQSYLTWLPGLSINFYYSYIQVESLKCKVVWVTSWGTTTSYSWRKVIIKLSHAAIQNRLLRLWTAGSADLHHTLYSMLFISYTYCSLCIGSPRFICEKKMYYLKKPCSLPLLTTLQVAGHKDKRFDYWVWLNLSISKKPFHDTIQ